MSEADKPRINMDATPSDPVTKPLVLDVEDRILPKEGPEASPALEDEPVTIESAAPADEKADDPVIMPPPPVQTDPKPEPNLRRSGGFIPALLGGALACGAGFAVSHYNLFNLRAVPEIIAPDLSAIEARLTALDAQVAKPAPPAPPGLSEEALAKVSAQFTAQVTALEEKLANLPQGDSSAALTALRQEVAALKQIQPSGLSDAQLRQIIDAELNARADQAAAKAAADAASAAEAAKAKALREAALFSLNEAKTTGLPFAAALATLDLNPPALSRYAQTGLPTLSSLQADFPEAARKALETSLRANAGEGLSDRLWSFLRIQSGARSLTPQEGSDPDAVLSRAEAALNAGDVPLALSEISALPPAGQDAFANWRQLAQDRLDGLAAIDAITAE